jgi:hypothetical protein
MMLLLEARVVRSQGGRIPPAFFDVGPATTVVASLVTVGPERAPLYCLVCQGRLFTGREIKLDTSGMEFLGLEWANRSGTALICGGCSFAHTFAGDGFEPWYPGQDYPS